MSRRRHREELQECDICGDWVEEGGFGRHYLACQERQAEEEHDRRALAKIAEQRKTKKTKHKRRKKTHNPDSGDGPSGGVEEMPSTSRTSLAAFDIEMREDEGGASSAAHNDHAPSLLPDAMLTAGYAATLPPYLNVDFRIPAPSTAPSPPATPALSDTPSQVQDIRPTPPELAPFPAPPLPTNIPTEASQDAAGSSTHGQPPLPTLPHAHPAPSAQQRAGNSAADYGEPRLDDIKVEYHPRSGRGTRFFHFEDYERERAPQQTSYDGFNKPYAPFNSLEDFKFAEIALEAGLKKAQIETLLNIIKGAREGSSAFTLRSWDDMSLAWDKAAVHHPPFEKHGYTLDYKNTPHEFEVYVRNLWMWIESVVREPNLAPHFQWDAQRLSKWDGEQWQPYYEDPWTGSDMWNAQSNLRAEDEKPLGIVLFSDKSNTSRFGTQQGYPVIARIANLESSVRNGTGFGGGCVVGFLPLVHDKPSSHKKTDWVDFKKVVWHEGFKKVLESVQALSKVGFAIRCGDGIIRKLFPYIHILSADYEEQCIMALIRGFRGKCPCPICLIEGDKLSDLHHVAQERTTAATYVKVTRTYTTEAAKENALKAEGLRPVINVFWMMGNTCIYKAMSFDRLHAYHLGIFGGHLWPMFKTIVNHKGFARELRGQIDEAATKMPRWRGLNHFDRILLMDFSDGNKYRDLSKVIIYTAYNILTKARHKAGYALLCAIRKYLECDMYMGYEVHTEQTLHELQNCMVQFGDLLQNFITIYENVRPSTEKEKSWDFPKIHTHLHAPRDIRAKGTVQHMSTRLFESFHGPIRRWAQQRTNNKNIFDQITKIDHQFLCCNAIRHRIETWNEFIKENSDSKQLPQPTASKAFEFEKAYLGSRQRPVTCADIEVNFANDLAFQNFGSKLITTLTQMFSEDPKLNVNQRTIIECRLVEVDYESMISWREESDLLRCSPSFFDAPRYDSIIFHDFGDTLTFAKLVFAIVCDLPHSRDKIPMLLVQPMQQVQRRPMDRELGLYPLKAKPRAQCRFIPLQSLIRGAVLYEDTMRAGHYFAVDVIDSDMFARVRSCFQGY